MKLHSMLAATSKLRRSDVETLQNDEQQHVVDTSSDHVARRDLHSLLNKVLYEGRNVNRKREFS